MLYRPRHILRTIIMRRNPLQQLAEVTAMRAIQPSFTLIIPYRKPSIAFRAAKMPQLFYAEFDQLLSRSYVMQIVLRQQIAAISARFGLCFDDHAGITF